MREICFTLTEIRAKPRPPRYEAEILALVRRREGDILWFDMEGSGWVRFHAKWRNYKPTPEDYERAGLKTKPDLTVANAISAGSALAFGEEVDPSRMAAREAICEGCDKFVADDGRGNRRCGVCGCGLGGRDDRILVLTRYVETTIYGCKHPEGSKWKKAGV